MKTNTIYTAFVAIVATVLTVSVSATASAQSSSRRNNSGGNSSATTQRSSDSRQKAAPVSQPSSRSTATPQNRNTSTSNGNVSGSRSTSSSGNRSTATPQNRNTSSGNVSSSRNSTGSADRQATQSRGNSSGVNTGRNYNDHMGNIRTESGIGSNNRPDNNRPNNGNVNRPDNNRPDNNRPNNGNVNRPDNNRPNNGNVNRPNNNGPRPTYYAGRGGDAATKLPPPPKYDRMNPNRHLGYNPFRDGRLIHRPAPIPTYFDYGYRVVSRPRHYFKVRINGMSMYFWGGVWYWHAYGYYNIHRPPVGTRVPISYIAESLYPVDFEYSSGLFAQNYYVDSYANFYVQVSNYQLEVVDAPDGAILYDMPSDYKEIVYYGRTYYVVGNSIFEYVYTNANSWYFRAVGIYR